MSDAFELHKKRLQTRGQTEMERMINDKLYSLQQAIKHGYNSEIVINNGVEHKVLINDNKQNIEYDEKYVSVEFKSQFKIGDTIYWPRAKSHWLITTEDLTEKAYFKGGARKAIYKVRWRDENDNICEVWAAFSGPTEKRIQQSGSGSFNYDVPNNTATIWFGAVDGVEVLKRYKYLMVAGKTWTINSVDPISVPGLVEIGLTENFTDVQKDNFTEQIARDNEYAVEATEQPSTFAISGADKTDALLGLTQTYSVSPVSMNGSWKVSPEYGTIISSNSAEATIVFSGRLGLAQVAYVVDGIDVSTKSVRITSIFG